MAVTANGRTVSEERLWLLNGKPVSTDEGISIGFDWSKDPPDFVNGNRLVDEGTPLERPAWEEPVASSRNAAR